MRHLTSFALAATLGVAILATIETSFGQGSFVFSNIGANGGGTNAIYGPAPADPHRQQWGNTPAGGPPGTNAYAGAPVAGTNYSVEAWRSLTPAQNAFALQPGASSVSGSLATFFTGAGAGFFFGGTVSSDYTYNPDQLPGQSQGVYLQVRGWDNAGGQLGTWDAAWNAAQAGGGNAVGWSKVFWQPLGFGSAPSPGTINFESFNIFTVPEPGTVSLIALGGAALFWSIRFRPHQRRTK